MNNFPLRLYLPVILLFVLVQNILTGCVQATVISPTQTATTVNIPSLTPTISPTLTAEERQIAVRELLKTNSGCLLPCWWGILPGKTSWAETEQFLVHLGVKVGSKPETDNGTIFHGTGGFDFTEIHIYNNVGFDEGKGVVETIYLEGDGSANTTDYQSIWAQYSPSQIMASYGKPSRVWVNSSSLKYGNNGKSGYMIWIFYDNLGFMIRYEGEVEYGSIYHICPKLEGGAIIDIQLLLQAPDNPLPLERDDSFVQLNKASIQSIENAAGINIDKFYKLFTEPGGSGCFDTPRDIWP
jgi:hypothetical protein